MRYVLIGIAMVAFMVLALAGFRGDISRKPPLEVFADMDRQPKLRPMEPNAFFKNGLSSQPLVKGTVARSEPLVTADGEKVYPFQTDHAVNKGYTIADGATNFVSIPLPVTMAFVERGRERFGISCVPCHGAQGDGNGIVGKFGFSGIRDLHGDPALKLADGAIYKIISEGQKSSPTEAGMMGYASNIDIADRWAIVAYVRALQLSRLGDAKKDNVPARFLIPEKAPEALEVEKEGTE
jgi:mono/diheme cytochrome c family protein